MTERKELYLFAFHTGGYKVDVVILYSLEASERLDMYRTINHPKDDDVIVFFFFPFMIDPSFFFLLQLVL